MEKRNLYLVIGIVAILAVALVLNFSNFTGFSIGDVGECADTDGGKDYFSRGTITYTKSDLTYTDYCIDYNDPKIEQKWLKEYYCTAGVNRMSSTKYLCVNGCENGACKR